MPAASGQGPERQTEMATFDEMRQQWQEAYNRGDLRAVAELYTEDARYYATDGHVDEGRLAIAVARQNEYDELQRRLGGTTFATKLEARERQEVGDTAVEIGDHTVSTSDGQVVVKGSYMGIAKKVRGEWKITRHMTTGVLPVGAEQERGLAGMA